MKQKTTDFDVDMIGNASRFLAKILRHSPNEYGVSLNSRGWANIKDVRMALNSEFDVGQSGRLLKTVLDKDDKNRFQTVTDSPYAFIRATRNHTTEEVDLLALYPDDSELHWYLVIYDEHQDQYVEATSVEAAKKVPRERLSIEVDWNNVSFEEVGDKCWDKDRPSSPDFNDSLSPGHAPNQMVHQHAGKPLMVERRVNMGGDKGRYIHSQPERIRDRLPP